MDFQSIALPTELRHRMESAKVKTKIKKTKLLCYVCLINLLGMKVAIAQNNYTQTDVEGNRRLILKSADAARAAGADLLIIAAHALPGTPLYDLRLTAGETLQAGIRMVTGPEHGGDVIFVPAADRFAHGAIGERLERYAEMARNARKPLVYVNHLGGQGDVVYDGSSFVLDAEGRLVKMLGSFGEDFAVVDTCDFGAVGAACSDASRDKIADAHGAIVLGLRDYFRKNGFTKACLGMSGGIDSAVVLALVSEVLGPENVMALMLPSQFSSGHSVSDSQDMIARLGVRSELIPIAPAYESVITSLAPLFAGTPFGSAEENLQARLRGVMLMALSNKHGYILLNTSNKSEAAVGYGTLYGDMAGSLAPIADLYKTEVYALAHYINRDGEVIPRAIIEKAPSAELRPGQVDSDSLPPYDILDAVLFQLVEQGRSVADVTGADPALVGRISGMLSRAEFKRRQAAPALRLSTRPFGSEFKLPLINKQ